MNFYEPLFFSLFFIIYRIELFNYLSISLEIERWKVK